MNKMGPLQIHLIPRTQSLNPGLGEITFSGKEKERDILAAWMRGRGRLKRGGQKELTTISQTSNEFSMMIIVIDRYPLRAIVSSGLLWFEEPRNRLKQRSTETLRSHSWFKPQGIINPGIHTRNRKHAYFFPPKALVKQKTTETTV
jgi:hypothetical protein